VRETAVQAARGVPRGSAGNTGSERGGRGPLWSALSVYSWKWLTVKMRMRLRLLWDVSAEERLAKGN